MYSKYIRLVPHRNQSGGEANIKLAWYVLNELSNNQLDNFKTRFGCCLGDMKTVVPSDPKHAQFIKLVIDVYTAKFNEVIKSNEYNNYVDNKITALDNTTLLIKNGTKIDATKENMVTHIMNFYIPLLDKIFNFGISTMNDILANAKKQGLFIFIIPSLRSTLKITGTKYDSLIEATTYNFGYKENPYVKLQDLSCSIQDGQLSCYEFLMAQALPRFEMPIIDISKHLDKPPQLVNVSNMLKKNVLKINTTKAEMEQYNENYLLTTNKDYGNYCVKYKKFYDDALNSACDIADKLCAKTKDKMKIEADSNKNKCDETNKKLNIPEKYNVNGVDVNGIDVNGIDVNNEPIKKKGFLSKFF